MRPILALNCLLQIEQERSEEESSVGDYYDDNCYDNYATLD